jgi:hypothetical protein
MNIKGMLAGLVLAGSAAAMMGCNQPLASTSDQSDVAQASSDEATSPVANWLSVRTGWGRSVVARPGVGAYWHGGYARFAPPAARYEVVGRAPSYRHFWAPGYYRWSGARYNWVGGSWMVRRPGFRYMPGHYSVIGGYYHYVPSHWVR